jgi:hypothetical protein
MYERLSLGTGSIYSPEHARDCVSITRLTVRLPCGFDHLLLRSCPGRLQHLNILQQLSNQFVSVRMWYDAAQNVGER